MAGWLRATSAILLVAALILFSAYPSMASFVRLGRFQGGTEGPLKTAFAQDVPPLSVEFNVSSGRELDFMDGDGILLPVFNQSEIPPGRSFDLLVNSTSDVPMVVDVSAEVTASSSSVRSPYFSVEVEPSQFTMQPRENTSVKVTLNDRQDAPLGNYKLTVYFATGNETLPFGTTLSLVYIPGLPTNIIPGVDDSVTIAILLGVIALVVVIAVKSIIGRRSAQMRPQTASPPLEM